MTKKIEPTPAYLDALEKDLLAAKERFESAKRTLYQHTATAKLGEQPFENARKACIDANKEIEKLQTEISKVKKALVQ